jgi:hypothetical protein
MKRDEVDEVGWNECEKEGRGMKRRVKKRRGRRKLEEKKKKVEVDEERVECWKNGVVEIEVRWNEVKEDEGGMG